MCIDYQRRETSTVTDNNTPPPLWDDAFDSWFDIDEPSGKLTFPKDHPTYFLTRADFAALGYSLDACQTATEIVDVKRRHLDFFSQRLDTRLAALEPNTL